MADTSKFKQLAPRMMRDLMRDFAPLADFQAAGIVGNGGGESAGFTIAQETHPVSGRGGLGDFQDTGPRRVDFEKWIRAHGGNPANMNDALNYDYNYGFLKHELETSERSTIPAIRKTQSLADATKSFMVTFERPGKPNISGRIGWSKMALDAYKAEQAQIIKTPAITKEVSKIDIPSTSTSGTIKPNAPADGIPKPKNNNGGFWATLLGTAGVTMAAVWHSFIEWLPLILGLVGLVVLAIFILRPMYVRWRDYLRHAPEFVELAHTHPWSAVNLLFDGFKSKALARATQGAGILILLLQGAQTLAGGDGSSLDTILPAITLPIGAAGWKIMASQYIAAVVVGVGVLQDKFREWAKSSAGQIDPVKAVEIASMANSIEGATPSPALAAVTDQAAVASMTTIPPPTPHGIDSSTLIGEDKVMPKKAAPKRKRKAPAPTKRRRVRRVSKRAPSRSKGKAKTKRPTPSKRKRR